jgi:hypothetical protein
LEADIYAVAPGCRGGFDALRAVGRRETFKDAGNVDLPGTNNNRRESE